jgi:hypothetical protein
MSIRSRVAVLATVVLAVGSSALRSEAAVPARAATAKMCVITCGPNDYPGCTLCRGECSDENHTVGCYYVCGGECPAT